uniref:Glycosyltransferase subfamily 4-like N-terminal domain-containing protein n=1 Tax=Leersia perrieri TaxID=77586 RepID=A0A0D9VYE2_9ORYZ
MHSRTVGYKVVFTDHPLYGFADAGSIHMNKVLQFTLADIDQAICVSHTSKENTILRSGISPQKVFMVPNAVDTAMFTPSPERLSCDEIVIVVISRLVYRKGADLLVEVIPEVCRLFPKVRFIVGGDGPKRVRLEEMREKFSLQDRVEIGLLQSHFGSSKLWIVDKPAPEDMVQAVKKAIDMLPSIDPQVMHLRVNFYPYLYHVEIWWKSNQFFLPQPMEGIEEVPDIGLVHAHLESVNDRCRTQSKGN